MNESNEQRDTTGSKFWDCSDDAERLYDTTIQDAVRRWAEDLDLEDDQQLPATVKVHGYAMMAMPSAQSIADEVLERLLESLDEEHADPEGDSTTATDAMQAAALAFATAVLADYENWCCEKVDEVTVNVRDYVPADWLVAALDNPESPAPAGAQLESSHASALFSTARKEDGT